VGSDTVFGPPFITKLTTASLTPAYRATSARVTAARPVVPDGFRAMASSFRRLADPAGDLYRPATGSLAKTAYS
jgi:hypothetical protein